MKRIDQVKTSSRNGAVRFVLLFSILICLVIPRSVYGQRPSAQHVVTSFKGHFKIHFDTTGRKAVDSTDVNRNSIPDYVDEVSMAFEEVWDVLIFQMGYNPPLPDADGFYDIYIVDLGHQTQYGWTYPEAFPAVTTTTYVEIDNDYPTSLYSPSSGIAGASLMKASCAYTFFYAVQWGYYFPPDPIANWLSASGALWLAHHIFGAIQFPLFFSHHRTALDSAYYEGGGLFFKFLHDRYGPESIRGIWEYLAEKKPQKCTMEDIDASLPDGGFEGVFPDFAVWNYFTGKRARGGYYNRASDLPILEPRTAVLGQDGVVYGSLTLERLSADYIRIARGAQGRRLSGKLQASFAKTTETALALRIILINDDDVDILTPPNPEMISIPNIENYDEVIFIPIIPVYSGSDHGYKYQIQLVNSPPTVTNRISEILLSVDEKPYERDLVSNPVFADADGDPVTYSVTISNPDVGSAVVENNNLILTPLKIGQTTVTLIAKDAKGDSTSTSFRLTVFNNAPIAVNDTVVVGAGEKSFIPVIENDIEPDGDPFEIVSVGQSSGSDRITVEQNNTVAYYPRPDFAGIDSFQYSISDGAQVSSATVLVYVGFKEGTGAVVLDGDLSRGDQGCREIQQSNLREGATVAIEIAVSEALSGIQGFQIVIRFDPDILDFDGFLQPDNISGIPLIDSSYDSVQISYASIGNIPFPVDTDRWGLIKFTTKQKPSDTTRINIASIRIVNQTGQEWMPIGLDGMTIQIKNTLFAIGEFDHDDKVGFSDFLLFAQSFGSAKGDERYSTEYDLDEDERIGFGDFLIFAQNFSQ